MWNKLLLQAGKTRKNRQKEYLLDLEKTLNVKEPVFVDRNLIEWKQFEKQTGIKIWQIKEENLSVAIQLKAENVIGRYKLTGQNSDVWEIWIDIDCNRDIKHRSVMDKHFKKLKEATTRVIETLLWFGIPEDCITIKNSGRGFHVGTFTIGIRNEAQYEQIMEAICEKTELPNVKTKDYKQLQDYVFGLDKHTLKKPRTKIREFGACNDKIQGIFHYASSISLKKFKKLRKYPFVQDKNKVLFPSITTFNITNRFIRKVHEINTDRLTQEFRETGKVIYNLDGEFKQLYKCPLVKTLAESAKKNHHLTNVERVFLSQLFPFFGKDGEKELHKIVCNCSDYDKIHTQYQIDRMKARNRKPITCRWAEKNIGCPECKGVAGKSPIKFAWKPKSLEEVHEVFQKWLCLKTPDGNVDLESLDIVLSVACDRQIAGDPLWLFIVAPPAGTKTTFIRALKDWHVYSLDKLTDKTLVSGMVRTDEEGNIQKITGILPDLDGKIFCIKDFTTILQSRPEVRNEISAQLRAAYDGYFESGYGTMKEPVRIESTFGIIAGVTPVIDVYGTLNALLGERFLKLRLVFDRRRVLKRVKENFGKEAQMHKELQKSVYSFLKGVDFSYEVEMRKYDQKLTDLALLIAQLRTPVWKRGLGFGEFATATEYASRLLKQLIKLLLIVTHIRGRKTVNDEDFTTVLRVALDTPPIERTRVLLWLYKNKEGTTAWISDGLHGISREIARRALREMQAIGQLVVYDEEDGTWRLHTSTRLILDGVNVVSYLYRVYTQKFISHNLKGKRKTHTRGADKTQHRKRYPKGESLVIDQAFSKEMWKEKDKR